MCGRYTLTIKPERLAERFELDAFAEVLKETKPRYNIAPSQGVLVVLEDRDMSERRADYFHWGLVPHWAKDPDIGYRMINARSETAAEKPAFRASMKYKRCLLPADGFYEWTGKGRDRRPVHVRMKDREPFGMAGLWAHWQSSDGSEILSCSILTTKPNELMEPIHDRMPVILAPEDYDRWLDPRNEDPGSLRDCLRPFDADRMEATAVSKLVNSPKNEGPELLTEEPELPF